MFFRQCRDVSTTLDIRTRLCALEVVAERVTKGAERMTGEGGSGKGLLLRRPGEEPEGSLSKRERKERENERGRE